MNINANKMKIKNKKKRKEKNFSTSFVTVGIPDPGSLTPLGTGMDGGMSEELSGVRTEPIVGMFFFLATFFG